MTSRTSRRVRPQWPPAPCVEEEPQSLSKELHGLSKIGDKPGVEGVHYRGAVNQYPIIVSANSPPPPSTSPASIPSVPGLGHVSSDESTGPRTPPLQEPVIRNTVRFEDETPKRKPQPASQTRGPPQPQPQAQQQPRREPSIQRESRPPQPQPQQQLKREPSVQRESRPPPPQPQQQTKREPSIQRESRPPQSQPQQQLKREPSVQRESRPPPPQAQQQTRCEPSVQRESRPPPPQAQQQLKREPSIQRESRPPRPHESIPSRPIVPAQHAPATRGPSAPDRTPRAPVPETYLPPKTTLGRSNSARYAPSAATSRPMPERFRREPSSGYLSDSATSDRPMYQAQPPAPLPVQAPAPTVPALPIPNGPTLAERIEEKLRQRHEQRDPGSMSDPESRQPAAKPLNINISLQPSVPATAPHSPTRDYRAPGHRAQIEPTTSRARAKSVTMPPSRSMSGARPPLRPLPEMTEKPKPAPTLVATQPSPDRALVQPTAPRHPSTSPQRSNPVGLGLSPCPRTIAVAGYQDWYTLKGLTHLDICPSCMSQIAHSRYRDFFIPSLSKPASQKTRCAFANAWTRLAWAQMIKKQHDSLELLYQMTRPPPGIRPCPGRIVAEQTWHKIYDPETKSDLPGFHICTSCARNIRILMPAHRDTFTANPVLTERICAFVTSSPRFVKFIDLLDASATRAENDRSLPDTRDFLNYARRKVVLRDCRRDRPSLSTWHFIPSLPELCICEDCYDEVVWPLARMNHPIARMVTTSMRLLPDGPGRTREASCQLYSPRMRARFRDAVLKNEFAPLKAFALRRVEAERRFLDRREELLIAQGRGYECDEEMRKAVDEWRRWE